LEGADPLALLSLDLVEKLPMIIKLEFIFLDLLPRRFGNVRIYISSTSASGSVVRAECQNEGCGVRAFIHIERKVGKWSMVEETPQLDRTQNKCGECRDMFSTEDIS